MRHGVFLILKPVDASTHLRVSSSTTCSTDPGVEVSSRGGRAGPGDTNSNLEHASHL